MGELRMIKLTATISVKASEMCKIDATSRQWLLYNKVLSAPVQSCGRKGRIFKNSKATAIFIGNPLMDVDSASIIEERWPHFKKPSQIENKEVDALSKVFYVL